MNTLIAYYRVSTAKQGLSGLGLESQQAQVEAYAKGIGATITASYTEVESGKRADRPELAKAIAHARRAKARLCIAKLDRLARNVCFISTLMESGVDFVAVDNQTANKLTIHILAAVAENEAAMISARTKAALAAAKARGTLLGSDRPGHWQGHEQSRLDGLAKGREASRIARREKAMQAVADLLPDMLARRAAGESLAAIAHALNAAGHQTTRGCEWKPNTVKMVLDRVVSK